MRPLFDPRHTKIVQTPDLSTKCQLHDNQQKTLLVFGYMRDLNKESKIKIYLSDICNMICDYYGDTCLQFSLFGSTLCHTRRTVILANQLSNIQTCSQLGQLKTFNKAVNKRPTKVKTIKYVCTVKQLLNRCNNKVRHFRYGKTIEQEWNPLNQSYSIQFGIVGIYNDQQSSSSKNKYKFSKFEQLLNKTMIKTHPQVMLAMSSIFIRDPLSRSVFYDWKTDKGARRGQTYTINIDYGHGGPKGIAAYDAYFDTVNLGYIYNNNKGVFNDECCFNFVDGDVLDLVVEYNVKKQERLLYFIKNGHLFNYDQKNRIGKKFKKFPYYGGLVKLNKDFCYYPGFDTKACKCFHDKENEYPNRFQMSMKIVVD